MALTRNTLKEIVRRVQQDIKTQLPDLDPTIYGTVINALAVSLANRSYDLQLEIEQLENQLFPQTATGEYLERWAAYEGLVRQPASNATGKVNIFSSSEGIAIDVDQEFTNNSNTYIAITNSSTTTNTVNISSLIRSGSEVTAISTDHGLASSQSLTISGANEAGYNGTYSITVLDTDTFSYQVSGSPSSPATGTIYGEWIGCSVIVQSEETGTDYNLDSGAMLSLISPPTGIESSAYAQFSGITGGSEVETDTSLLNRTLQSRSNPVANFNDAAIEKVCLNVPGVTRVLVKDVYPNIGEVTILFVRDNDANIIPSNASLQEVKDVVTEITPANTSTDDVHVLAPSASIIDFQFSSISPNTPTMQGY